jgi:High potential iron-sulfur protein
MLLVNRRRALQLIGVGIGTASGLVVLAGCKSDEPGQGKAGGQATGGTCADKNPGDENAKQLRKNLQYKEKAVPPEKKCGLCVQYEPGKYGDCGGCKLFGGGVNPEGGCLSFAPKAGAPAPAGGPPGVATPPGVAPPPASPPGVPPPAPTKG